MAAAYSGDQMATKRSKPKYDRRSLYLPRPATWEWDRLSEVEIGERLKAAWTTQETLAEWVKGLEKQQEEERQALWARLPDTRLANVQQAIKELDELGKLLKALRGDQDKVEKAIAAIERHREMASGVRLAK